MRAPMRSSDGEERGRGRVVCAGRMPTMHSLYLSLPHYASTVALSRIPKVGLARGQVGSRFCRTPYISPRDGPARVENQPISPATLPSITTLLMAFAALRRRFELIHYKYHSLNIVIFRSAGIKHFIIATIKIKRELHAIKLLKYIIYDEYTSCEWFF